MEATVSEIHAWPLRPEGFEEPLFRTRGSRRSVMEHLARSPWLGRASEAGAGGRSGASAAHAAKALGGPARLEPSAGGLARGGVLRCEALAGRGLDRKRVDRVVERWRQVASWWEPGGGADRILWRVELEGGAQVDLCRDRAAGSWSVVGIVD